MFTFYFNLSQFADWIGYIPPSRTISLLCFHSAPLIRRPRALNFTSLTKHCWPWDRRRGSGRWRRIVAVVANSPLFTPERGEVNWRKGREVDCLERQTSLCLPTCKWPPRLLSWALDSSLSIAVADSIFHSICEGGAMKFAFNTWETRRYRTAGMLLMHGWMRYSRYGREVSFCVFFLVIPLYWGTLMISLKMRQNETIAMTSPHQWVLSDRRTRLYNLSAPITCLS